MDRGYLMSPEKKARSFLIMMGIIFIIVLVFPGTPGEESFFTIVVGSIAVPTVSYNIWKNYKKIPKIYSVLEIVVVVICAILVIYTIFSYLT